VIHTSKFFVVKRRLGGNFLATLPTSYFRKRIGSAGFDKILSAAVAMHGESAIEDEMCVDTTVQEKNTTFPTDAKQYRKIHGHLLKLTRAEGIQLPRTHEKKSNNSSSTHVMPAMQKTVKRPSAP